YQEFLAYGDDSARVKLRIANPRAGCEWRTLPLSRTGYVRPQPALRVRALVRVVGEPEVIQLDETASWKLSDDLTRTWPPSRLRVIEEQRGSAHTSWRASRIGMEIRSILTRPLHLIDNKHLDRQSCRLQSQPQLLLHRSEERWPRSVRF